MTPFYTEDYGHYATVVVAGSLLLHEASVDPCLQTVNNALVPKKDAAKLSVVGASRTQGPKAEPDGCWRSVHCHVLHRTSCLFGTVAGHHSLVFIGFYRMFSCLFNLFSTNRKKKPPPDAYGSNTPIRLQQHLRGV